MTVNSEAVEHALSLILKEPFFTATPKAGALLSYVVSTTLKGDGESLKAYTVAVNALGKPESFEPQNDPYVRELASSIRTALNLYNQKPNTATLVITMELGSYRPVFTRKNLKII